MPVQHEFVVAQRCDFSSFVKKIISERMLIQSPVLCTQTYTYLPMNINLLMNITLKEYFQNNKNRKTLVSFPELTDNIKICSQVYHQISLSLLTESGECLCMQT